MTGTGTPAGTPTRPLAHTAAAIVILAILTLFTFATLLPEAGGQRAQAVSGSGILGAKPKKNKKAKKAKLKANGKATIPAGAPKRVRRAIRAANRIVGKPYGAPSWRKNGTSRQYDCSAAVSYALGKKGAKLLKNPTWSGPLMKWGKKGKGKWITVYSNHGHAYVMIAGLRFESRGSGDGPRWRKGGASKRDWSGVRYAIRKKPGF